jgi:hypothetical protein
MYRVTYRRFGRMECRTFSNRVAAYAFAGRVNGTIGR